MRATVSVDQLKVDKALYDFVNDEAIPGSGIQAADVLEGFCGAGSYPGTAQRRAAAQTRRVAGKDRRLASTESRSWLRSRKIQGLLERDRLSGGRGSALCRQHRKCRCGNRPDCRPATGGAGQQCPLRAQCRQRSLGQLVRRALRHRRDSGGRRAARRQVQSATRRQGHRFCTRFFGSELRACRRLAPRFGALPSGERRARGQL